MPESSSFKYLYSTVFKNGGDFSKVPAKIKSTPIKCFVKESYPYFLISDDYFYIPAYFTKKAVDGFKSGSNTGIADLKSKVIIISDWSLELARVKSSDVFTSYGGVELKLIVNSFSVAPNKDQGIQLKRQPVNLYRDTEVKTLVNHFIWTAQSKAIPSAALPDISKLSGKGNVSAGIVSFNCTVAPAAKTNTIDVSSTRKGGAKAGKATVKGGLVKAKTTIKKAVASKVAKSKTSVGKKSTGKGKTPGGDASGKATSDIKTMSRFKKMMALHKKRKN